MGSGPHWVFRPKGIEVRTAGGDPGEVAETPGCRVMAALARLADKDGFLAGTTPEEIAAEAGVPAALAGIELKVLLASETLFAFLTADGPVWVLPDYENAVMPGRK